MVAPPVWHTYSGSQYFIDDTPTIRWEDARNVCLNMGADLPIITSDEQNNFIWELSLKQETVTEFGVWIGLFRKADDKFYWVDGKPYFSGVLHLWRFNNPDNHNGMEDCVHITHGGWNDFYCDANRDILKAPVVVCQKKI